MVKRVKANVESKGKRKPGRPKGTTNIARRTGRAMTLKDLRERAIREGELPSEFLLRVARGMKIDGYKPSFEQRLDAAKAAAPFFMPKLSAVAVKEESAPDKQFVFDEERLKALSHEELVVFQKIFGKLLSGGDAGKGEDSGNTEKTENRYTRTIDLKPE